MTSIQTAGADAAPRQQLGLRLVQRRRKLALGVGIVLASAVLPFVHSIGTGESTLHEGLEVFGMVVIVAAIVGRSWCTLYIGGRKGHEIVATGPYSISRNPLYVFSLLGIAGIGFQTGSLVFGLTLVALALAIFVPTILQEEKALARNFGADYRSYMQHVPRFGPNFAGWRDMETLVVHPSRLARTFFEALPFLLAVPVCETIEKLQDAGIIVPWLHLP